MQHSFAFLNRLHPKNVGAVIDRPRAIGKRPYGFYCRKYVFCNTLILDIGISLFDYQMTTLLEGARYIPSDFFTRKVSYHSGKFLGGILVRR